MKLVCPECRRENEPERIYCHECGARLDRSRLAKQKTKEEDPKETQKRLRGMLDPRRAKMRLLFFHWAKLILGALAAAAVVQMLRPPDLPAQTEELMPTQINLELENAATDARATPLRYTEEQVNDYLVYTLKGKQAALSQWLTFERAVAVFGEGWAQVTVARSLFGYPLFTTAGYEPAITDGAMTARSRGGAIGRLPVHPALMQHAGFLFTDLWTALDRERKSLVKLGGVELVEKTVVLRPRQP